MARGRERDNRAAEMGRRLSDLTKGRGWNQSELARRAERHTPQGKRFGRDNVSNYIRGKHVPSPVHLYALAKALDVDEAEIMPPVNRTPPSFRITDLGGGQAQLEIDKKMPLETAIEILRLLDEGNSQLGATESILAR